MLWTILQHVVVRLWITQYGKIYIFMCFRFVKNWIYILYMLCTRFIFLFMTVTFLCGPIILCVYCIFSEIFLNLLPLQNNFLPFSKTNCCVVIWLAAKMCGFLFVFYLSSKFLKNSLKDLMLNCCNWNTSIVQAKIKYIVFDLFKKVCVYCCC